MFTDVILQFGIDPWYNSSEPQIELVHYKWIKVEYCLLPFWVVENLKKIWVKSILTRFLVHMDWIIIVIFLHLSSVENILQAEWDLSIHLKDIHGLDFW